MKDEETKYAYTAAIAGGAILWFATAGISGKTEAWDSPFYWMITYPLAIGLAGGLGYWIPEKPWRWGLTVMLVQAVVLVITGSGFGLLPLGLILFSILAFPAIIFAHITAKIRLRDRNKDT